MENTVLQVKNLSKKFKKNEVVKSVSFNIKKGEILGFLGPNGAGKTTTIRMITGLMKPDEGEVIICDKSVEKSFEEAIAHVGAIVETPHLYQYMTGRENINFFAGARKHITKEQINQVINLSGLDKRLDEKVKNYSLGMKQRLGLAVALIHEPELLILDEPTNGLDPAGTRELREFLKEFAHQRGGSVLVSSHILTEMQLLCDRIAIIANGEIKCVKSIDEIKGQLELEDLFIKETQGGHI